jgi:transcriptional regulator with XRE-family HTH domain
MESNPDPMPRPPLADVQPTPFGERLREARERGRLSMRELAEAASLPMANVPDAKITHTPVSLIESGRQTTVDVVTAVRLARALGVTVEWLVTGEPS